MHPILIHVTDGFFISTYGVLIAIGLLAATWLAAWRAKRRGIAPEMFFDLAVIAVVSGFIGARILYILTDLRGFAADPMSYILARTGFVFLGGLIAATGACIWYIRRRGLDLWLLADIAVPSLAIGHAFGRIGCHLSGCCYGGVCESPLGIQVPMIATEEGIWPNAYADHLHQHLLDPAATHSLTIWPVQLLESGGLFFLGAVLLFIASRPRHKGLVFGLYLAGYSVLRFGLEFLRGDAERGLYFGGHVSTSQIISVLMFAAGLYVLYFSRGLPVFDPASVKPYEPPMGNVEEAESIGADIRRKRKKARIKG